MYHNIHWVWIVFVIMLRNSPFSVHFLCGYDNWILELAADSGLWQNFAREWLKYVLDNVGMYVYTYWYEISALKIDTILYTECIVATYVIPTMYIHIS